MFPIRDHHPSSITPYVTIGLIVINVALFVLTAPWAGGMVRLWLEMALYPVAVVHGFYVWGLLTHMFLHAGLLHLGGNMLFLWVFGDNLEEQMGHVGFLIFYLACGLLAAAAQILSEPFSDVPMVGASGAIAGVMGGYLLMFPRSKIDVIAYFIIFFRRFTLSAWIVLALWFVAQVAGGYMIVGTDDGVAHWAHAGGFAAGVLLAVPLFIRRGATAFWRRTDGHPPHPPVPYAASRIPTVPR